MPVYPPLLISIEGNIGSGKTSLTGKLASHYGGQVLLEEFEENSFLPSYYKNPGQFAFHVEMKFLMDRFRQINAANTATTTIMDYTFDKCLLFSKFTLSEKEQVLFNTYFNTLKSQLKAKPEVIIYLEGSTDFLLSRIYQRGRAYEQNITKQYLETIGAAYNQHFEKENTTRLIKYDVEKFDFINNPEHFQWLLSDLQGQKKTEFSQKNEPIMAEF